MKPYHINKKQILIMGCLGMFPLFSSAQDILSTSGTSRWGRSFSSGSGLDSSSFSVPRTPMLR